MAEARNLAMARVVATRWVRQYHRGLPGYAGAWMAGSVAELPPDAIIPVGSDVDVMLAVDNLAASTKPGKSHFDGLLIEGSFVPWSTLSDPERVLEDYHLAHALSRGVILDDPTGRVGLLQHVVVGRFPYKPSVQRRSDLLYARITQRLLKIDLDAPLHERMLGWLFSASLLCHLILVAALRNPTIRRRYTAAREVLMEYGLERRYPPLLATLGSNAIRRKRVEEILADLTPTFDAAALYANKEVQAGTPFASDISNDARSIVFDGSRAMIDEGDHREAIYWLAVTYARCHWILARHAPPLQHRLLEPMKQLCRDLGLAEAGEMSRRREDLLRMLPDWRRLAEAIAAANPAIVHTD